MIAFHGFDWDEGNIVKCQSHGVSLAEIESLFAGEPATSDDETHSVGEARYYAVGRTETGRALFVVYTWREREGRALIRPISARYMHRKEVAAHG